MSSIYQDYTCQIKDHLCALDQYKTKASAKMCLDIAKLFLTNAKDAADAFIRRKLTRFNPIVGENSCQIRGSFITGLCNIREAEALKSNVDEMLLRLNKLYNKPPSVDINQSFEKIMRDLGLELKVSETMLFLLRVHMLTVGKVFRLAKDGREVYGLDCSVIKARLSKQMDVGIVKNIIHVAREQLSVQSVNYMQNLVRHLPLASDRDVKQLQLGLNRENIRQISGKLDELYNPTPFTFQISPNFINVKAILLKLRETQTPILLKEYRMDKQEPQRFYYRAEHAGGKFVRYSPAKDSKQSCFVLESIFSQNTKAMLRKIRKVGLYEAILANAAAVPQYSSDDDFSKLQKSAQKELKKYREIGNRLGFTSQTPQLFNVVIARSASVHEEPSA